MKGGGSESAFRTGSIFSKFLLVVVAQVFMLFMPLVFAAGVVKFMQASLALSAGVYAFFLFVPAWAFWLVLVPVIRAIHGADSAEPICL